VDHMVAALHTFEGPQAQVLMGMLTENLSGCLRDFQNFRALVEQTIDLQQAEERTYCINRKFDALLGELAQRRDEVRAGMESVRQTVEGALGILGKGNSKGEKTVSLVDAAEGQALRVVKRNQQTVQHFKGEPRIKVLAIKKMECIFTTPEMEKRNGQFKEACANYEKHSAHLVSKALAVASTYAPVVDRLAETLGNLDVLMAFARVVLTAPCSFTRARLDATGKKFEIDSATHVLVVANSEKSFVANDLNMDQEASRLHIITGPNMGGKSTYIRSVALIALLNQVGCFVPCRSATLPIFDSIMCRVGASDMQLRGISTFMAEMLEAACILNTATTRSLVIVDELGRGTSTSDGFGIAWAIAKHLVEETRCFCLFATHFHELATLENVVPGVRNRHATAAVDPASGQLTFLYALANGAADQSYGLHVAELAGFPQRVITASKRKAVELEAESGCGTSNAENDVASYVMAAVNPDDFVQRAQERLPQLLALGGQLVNAGA